MNKETTNLLVSIAIIIISIIVIYLFLVRRGGGGIRVIVVGLFLLVTTAALPSVSASGNCVDIDCLKNRLRIICELELEDSKHIDCDNILRCMNAGEQEIMRECVKGYPADNESRSFTATFTGSALS